MTVDEELKHQLADAIADFDAAHRADQAAQEQFRQLDQQLGLVKTTLMEAITVEQAGGKPKFSNDDRRKAELSRRLQESYGSLLEMHQAADDSRRQTAAELERCHEALKTARVQAELRIAQLRLEAAHQEAMLSMSLLQPLPVFAGGSEL